MLGLFMFTFVTMVGGNPDHDAYGFRAWRDPGPVAEFRSTGASGRLQGFWVSRSNPQRLLNETRDANDVPLSHQACMLSAGFAVAGPDMLSLIAAETINPRKVMPQAFKTVAVRLVVFFVLSALAVGIVVPSNDPILLSAIEQGLPGAGRSPYVAAMTRLRIKVLPHIVNGGILTSVYSAGSAFAFNASRTLHGMAVDGLVPAFIKKTNRNGVPWVAFLISIAVGCLSFLQAGSAGTSKVLDWFIGISTATQLVTWIAMSITYLCWRRACRAQGVDRDSLPYKSRWLPYGTYFALPAAIIVTLTNGYDVFLNGGWDTATFIFAYASPFWFIFVFILRKAVRRVPLVKAHEAQLWVGLEEIEEHEATLHLDDEARATTGKQTKWDTAKSWII